MEQYNQGCIRKKDLEGSSNMVGGFKCVDYS